MSKIPLVPGSARAWRKSPRPRPSREDRGCPLSARLPSEPLHEDTGGVQGWLVDLPLGPAARELRELLLHGVDVEVAVEHVVDLARPRRAGVHEVGQPRGARGLRAVQRRQQLRQLRAGDAPREEPEVAVGRGRVGVVHSERPLEDVVGERPRAQEAPLRPARPGVEERAGQHGAHVVGPEGVRLAEARARAVAPLRAAEHRVGAQGLPRPRDAADDLLAPGRQQRELRDVRRAREGRGVAVEVRVDEGELALRPALRGQGEGGEAHGVQLAARLVCRGEGVQAPPAADVRVAREHLDGLPLADPGPDGPQELVHEPVAVVHVRQDHDGVALGAVAG
mmetsp:Transcript_110627/g.346047  ORF Transcript_110627/g.346047 Transcript_110627/m.346047 type:complete len:337 (+) Transcript_110627:3-1013(+)